MGLWIYGWPERLLAPADSPAYILSVYVRSGHTDIFCPSLPLTTPHTAAINGHFLTG